MKTIVTTCAALCIALSSFAQEDKVKEMDAVLVNKDAIPGPVIAKAQKDFPNASPFNFYSVGESNLNRDWNVTESVNMKPGEKVEYYKIDMKGKNGNFEALYDGAGKLIASREEQKDVALPPAVRNAWATGDYKGMALEKDKHVKVIDHGKKTEYYVLSLGGGKKVTYDASGKLVKKPK